ncbi:phosphoribulokinase [Planktotalea sp.]|uniref:phosphoribulokinase n=1 Tax=Planktotalea sp. TaxID=2029877 RepID=UPI003299C084
MTDLNHIAQQIAAVPLRGGRRIVALVGAPASGKSTLSDALMELIPKSAVVPMDGFHLSNDALDAMGRRPFKGAPDTFDVEGLIALTSAIQSGDDVRYPTFDRKNDSVVPEGGQLPSDCETVIVEGNYLLLNAAPWDGLVKAWDFTIMLEVPLDVLQERLVQRWLKHGYDAEGALERAMRNDIPNAKTVVEKSRAADVILRDPQI